MNLFTLLERSGRRWPGACAVFSGTRQCQTWAELHRRALALAGALGPRPGRIAIASENCPQYPELLFDTWAAGGAVVPMNHKLHPREMVQIAQDAEPAWLFASPTLAPGLAAALAPPWRERVLTIGSAGYEALFDAVPGNDLP